MSVERRGGSTARRAKTKPKDATYRPSSRPVIVDKSSPYPTRKEPGPSTEELTEEVLERAEVESEVSDEAEMAKREETSRDELLTMLAEQRREDEQRRREDEIRREAERREDEKLRREAEERKDALRHEELRELFEMMNRGGQGAEERRDEEERKERRQKLKDRLASIGTYKEPADLQLFLDKYERLMRECKVERDDWLGHLLPKLDESLYARASRMVDKGEDYAAVRLGLLRSKGDTIWSSGVKVFGLTGEELKTVSGADAMDKIVRLVEGLFQGAVTRNDYVFALSLAMSRHVLPPTGRVFLENRGVSDLDGLRNAWDDWRSGRDPNNFFRPAERQTGGGGFRRRDWRDREDGITCFLCGEKGHRRADCKRGAASSPNVDRVNSPPARKEKSERHKLKCFLCDHEGHRWSNCPLKEKVKTEAKVAETTVSAAPKANVVRGLANGVEVELLLDSGANVGMVSDAEVPKEPVECGYKAISGAFDSNPKILRCIEVKFTANGQELTKVAAVNSEMKDKPRIMPIDLADERDMVFTMNALKKAEIDVLTRAQAAEEFVDSASGDGVAATPLVRE